MIVCTTGWRGRFSKRRRPLHLLSPVTGFSICLFLWWNLSLQAKLFGILCLAVVMTYAAYASHGFATDCCSLKHQRRIEFMNGRLTTIKLSGSVTKFSYKWGSEKFALADGRGRDIEGEL